MIRFGINTLLVLALLLSQLAAAPHMHASDVHQSSPHGGQPHFHLHRFLPTERAEGTLRPPGRDPCLHHGCPDDHDADAFYLSDTAGAPDARADVKALPAFVAYMAPADDRPAAERLTRARACEAEPPSDPLYIRHRALLN